MSKKDFRVYNFDFGTITENQNEIKIDMEIDQFTHTNTQEITNNMSEQNQSLLPLENIKESENYLSLYYRKSDKLKNLTQIKHEEYPVKISIAKQILEDDILEKYAKDNIFISINPATVYYYPMQTVRYTYTGNQFMPRENYTTLERYKACVISILSGIAYEKCLNSPNEVKQEGNELIEEIYNQNTREELLEFIKSSEDYITYDYISNKEKRNQKNKQFYRIALISTLGVAIIGVLFTQMNASGNQEEMAQAYEQQINNQELIVQGNEQLEQGNYEEGLSTLEEAGADSKETASKLVQEGQYQLAINTDEAVLEQVIQHAYNNDNQGEINNLNDEQLSEEASSKLNDEQTIISGDSSGMDNVFNFLNDENTAERLANAYLQNNNADRVQQIADQYPENQSIQEIANNASQQQKISEIESQIDDLNSEKEDLDEDDDSDQIEDIDNQIDDLNNQIDDLQNNNNNDNNNSNNE